MIPETPSELVALVNQIKNDALALLEALYESQPALGFADRDAKSVWIETEHPRDDQGRFAHSSWMSAARGRYHHFPHQSFGDGIESVEGGSGPSPGSFDSLHHWTGKAVPERQSAAFQDAKVSGLQAILPYARNVYREVGIAVIKKNGRLYGFATGTPNRVDVRTPWGEPIALLHTHSYEGAHSELDWGQFITAANTTESHVITPDTTYSLHKPPGWKAEDYGFEAHAYSDTPEQREQKKAAIIDEYLQLHNRAIDLIGGDMSEGWEARSTEIINQKLADKYGIIFRIGKRVVSARKSAMEATVMDSDEIQITDEDRKRHEENQIWLDNYFSKPQTMMKKLRDYVEELKALGKPLYADPATIQRFRDEVEEEAAAWHNEHPKPWY